MILNKRLKYVLSLVGAFGTGVLGTYVVQNSGHEQTPNKPLSTDLYDEASRYSEKVQKKIHYFVEEGSSKTDYKLKYGTGTIICPNRVLTAEHVLPPTGEFYEFEDYDGSMVKRRIAKTELEVGGIEAKVLARDEEHDIALLELENAPKDCYDLKLADSLEVGEYLFAVGASGGGTFISGYLEKISDDTITFGSEVPGGMSGSAVYSTKYEDLTLVALVIKGGGTSVSLERIRKFMGSVD